MINNAAAWRQYNRQIMVMPRELDAYVKTTKSTEKRREGLMPWPMPWLLLKDERMGNFTQLITYTCNEYQHNRPEHIHHGIGVNEESQ